MNENFYQAAIRHWVDGAILEQQGEYDSAVCMQGFAAECALKAILRKGITSQTEAVAEKLMREYGHSGDILFEDLEMMFLNDVELTSIIDPGCAIRLSEITLPEVLFDGHPARRYYGDGVFSEADARASREGAEQCLRELMRLQVDGYI